MGDLQEWSYGFDIVKAKSGQFEERDVRFLEKLLVHEVSPVLLGAGIGTRTLSAKSGAKGALPPHAAETTDADWDAAAVVSALPSERPALRAVHAWVDPDGDPDAKSSYKFPHHMGPDGPANMRACSAGIAFS